MPALTHLALAAGALAAAYTAGGTTQPKQLPQPGAPAAPAGQRLAPEAVPLAGPASWPFGRSPPRRQGALPVTATAAATLAVAREAPVAPPRAVAAAPAPAPEPVAAAPDPPRAVPRAPGMAEPFLQAWIQLAAYRRPGRVTTGWELLSRRYAEQLDGLVPAVLIATPRPGEGSYYRLLAGPLPTGHAARGRCLALAAAGNDACIVRRPDVRPAWPPASLRDEVPVPPRRAAR